MSRVIEWKSVRLHLAKLDRLHRFIVFLLLAAVVFIGVSTARYFYLGRVAKTAGRQDAGAGPKAEAVTVDKIEVRNETRAVVVVSKKVEKEFLVMEIRNAGPRPILSYRIDLRDDDMFVTDLSIGSPLAPLRTTHVAVPLKKLSFDEQSQKYLLTISIALFTDGTGEGDKVKMETQRDWLIGEAQALSNMSGLIAKLQSEEELESDQLTQQILTLKSLIPANFNRNQTVGYMSAVTSLRRRAMVLNKLPDNNKAGGVDGFKTAFQRQLSNLKMLKMEVKK